MEGPTENNEAPLSLISQDFLDRWDAKGKSKEIFERPQGVSRKTWEKHVSRAVEKDRAQRHERFLAKQAYYTIVALSRRVGLNKALPDSITEEMLDEDDNTPMSEEEGDHDEYTAQHINTDTPAIHAQGGEAIGKVEDADDFTTHHTHVHGGEATMKADDDGEEGVICLWERGEKE
ncbi:hypothetical protein FCIRC_2259 [Fusarium circinatum]|uniref:Uncharacterized protein n=1 Tax=Fusarium circinatum TaxID=48490 RepID=A0A8H5UHL5_FUSCI|nr:hypothetical protein FCIRC_2259 [Fusarium circinatum]